MNGKRVTIPSYRVRKGDHVTLKQSSREIFVVRRNMDTLDRQRPPWIEAGDGGFRGFPSRGDPPLGGDEFDQEIVRFLLNEIREDSGLNLEEDRLARHKLRIAAERAKIELSTRDEASIEIPLIGSNIFGACNLDTIITRDDLERMIRGFVRQTIRLTRGALGDASVRPEDVDHVLLVGGSTRMPIVRAAVMELIGREPEADLDPDLAVARGAAMEAAVLSGAASETVLVDVTPLGLGVQTAREGLVRLSPRNTVLPARARAVFTTVSDNQRRARVTVLQGERPRAEDNVLIGSFDLDGIEPARCGKPDIEVQFDVDVDGILQVRATDLTTTSSEMVTLEAPMSIDDDAVTEAVEQAREAELERALPGYGGARS